MNLHGSRTERGIHRPGTTVRISGTKYPSQEQGQNLRGLQRQAVPGNVARALPIAGERASRRHWCRRWTPTAGDISPARTISTPAPWGWASHLDYQAAPSPG